MNVNRKYTGLERTPASMAWLIRKKGIIQGQIDRIEKQIEEAPGKLKFLRDQAAALDSVIPMHRVVVDPTVIKGKRQNAKAILPYNVITRGIYECLKNARGVPRSTIEVALHIASSAKISLTKKSKLRLAVGKRLGTLAGQGKIRRHHDLVTADYGYWSLAPEYFQD